MVSITEPIISIIACISSVFITEDNPPGSNFTNKIDTNIGNMKNKGVELAFTGIPVKTKDWEWSVSGNFTWNASEITKLNTIDSEDNYIQTGSIGDRDYVQMHKVGKTPYTYFLMKQAYDDAGASILDMEACRKTF